ncbi:SOS response-associated peptidase [Planctomicrobium piriforme]|uniref:Abasic site processing protein n=1 Tax=Planctomicrobium piriforme TaxID=1576369 RepID=A0A1I3E0D7_9PLAN|nr:SOS response-associated peptidase [Planctomicrobium piriforme]SFH92151.1 SOS response associated peptidase (SRAP) [Planctomicrobium piriforme]
MCGRYNLRATPAQLKEFFHLFREPEGSDRPRYNFAPTQTVVAIRGVNGHREAGLFRWELVPVWAKDLMIGASLINARADTVATKSAFRSDYKRRRCLIPAGGFYEWLRGRPSRSSRSTFTGETMPPGIRRLVGTMGQGGNGGQLLLHPNDRRQRPDAANPHTECR